METVMEMEAEESELSSSNNAEDKENINPNKRIPQVVKWFITFPQCPLEKEMMLELLKEKMNIRNNEIKEYVIGRETHKDGNYHLHCFISLKKKIKWKKDLFDVVRNNVTYHGNYQACKNRDATIEYIKKSNDFICTNKTGIYKEKNQNILSKELKDLVDNGDISIHILPTLYRSKAIYKAMSLSADHGLTIPRKCIWIVGYPGVGKSYIAREVFPNIYNKPRNLWWDGYNGQNEVLIEDWDKSMKNLSSELKIWSDNYYFEGEIKNGFCKPIYTILIITSNYNFQSLFDFDAELLQAITRRFKIVEYADRNMHDIVSNRIVDYIKN